MSNQYDDDIVAEETGLNLFDDRASAAGSFTREMFGYDRGSVDAYVRDIETQLSTLKQLTRHLRHEVALAQRTNGTTDFTRLGSHATGILRAAEAQGEDLVTKAGLEAERIKEEGRRVAADLRANAQAEADDIRVAGLANLRQLRDDLETEQGATLAAARTEAGSVIAAAQRQADAITTEARQNAANTVQGGQVEADRRVAEANRRAAEVVEAADKQARALLTEARSQADRTITTARTTAEEHLGQASARHGELTEKASALLAEATRHHEESSQQLAGQAAEAQQIRARALAEAEQTKTGAAREAENTIAQAHRQAAMLKDRLEEQYAWRKEQLEREVAALLQRKASVTAQLSNLRQLAGDAPIDFPDEDPFGSSDPREPRKPADEASQETRVSPTVSDTEVVERRESQAEDTQVFDEPRTTVVDASDFSHTQVIDPRQ